MKTHQDLDSAVDHVAARMVAVPDDPEMVTRIISALPERSSRLGWLIPQLAALGALAIAAVVWSTRERPAAPALLPAIEIATVTEFPRVATAIEPGTLQEPGTAFRTIPSEPSQPSEPLSRLDFERALPAIEAVDALMVSDVSPRELPAVPALTLAPIGVADLPLTAEFTASSKEF